MKVTIEMENLQSIIEDAARINTEKAIQEALVEVAHNKVDEVLKGKIEQIVNDSIAGYVEDYIKNAKVQVGNSWSGEGVKEYTVEEYLKKQVAEIFQKQMFETKYKDRWGDTKIKSVSFKDYLDEKISAESLIKPHIERLAKDVRDDVNSEIKEVFNDAMRKTLAENVFQIISASDTYRTISNSLNLLGE